MHEFWRNIFILLNSINWPNFIAWLHLLPEILNNIRILIICEPGRDVIYFEINLNFLTKLFFLHDLKFKTKIKYLGNENSF